MPNWARLLIRVALSFGLSALVTWIGWKLGQKSWALIALVGSIPVVGFAIANPLIELSHEGIAWMWHSGLREWEGHYYEFAGVHIRVYELDGRLWFAGKDVIKAADVQANPRLLMTTNPRGCREIPGTGLICLTAEAVEEVILAQSAPEGGRFINWMKREVLTPWERKRSGALAAR